MRWIHLTQDKDQYLVLVKTVTNLRIAYKAELFLTI